MPTYRNDTDRKITDGDRSYMEWLPGQVRALDYHIPYERLGLTKISIAEPISSVPDTSVFRDWMIQLTPNDPITLDLPYFEAFELSIYAETGSALATIADGEEAFYILPDESHFSTYSYARCPSVTLISDKDAVIRVKQEERNTKNTLRRGA